MKNRSRQDLFERLVDGYDVDRVKGFDFSDMITAMVVAQYGSNACQRFSCDGSD